MNKHERRALIISTDLAVLERCQQVLHDTGFSVHVVQSVQQVREQLAEEPFDLILLDLPLDASDDLTPLAEIRRYDPTVPLVLSTGTATLAHVTHATRVGAQGVLLKPLDAVELHTTINSVLQRRLSLRTHNRVTALRPLVHISQRLLAELNPPRLHGLIIETVRTELQADRASLMLWDDNGETLRIAACSGLPQEVSVGQQVDSVNSLAGWVARRGQSLLVNSQDCPVPELQTMLRDDRLVSALSVPVVVSGRILGVLNASKTQVGPPFTEDNKELLVLLAGQAAIAIENARLYNLAQRRADRLSMLYKLSTAVTGSLDLEQIIATTMQQVKATFGIDHGYLFLSATTPQHLVQYMALWQGSFSSLLPVDVFVKNGIIGQVLADGHPRVVAVTAQRAHNAGQQPVWEQVTPLTPTVDVRSRRSNNYLAPIPYVLAPTPFWLCVALISERGICGAIELLGQPGQQFGEDDIQLMTAVAAPVATAIEKARLHASVSHSEARYRALLHHATEAVLLLDSEGQAILDVNPAVEQLSGYDRDILCQLDIHHLLPEMTNLSAVARTMTTTNESVNGSAQHRFAAGPPYDLGRNTIVDVWPSTTSTRTAADAKEIETILLAQDGRNIPVSIGVSRVPYDGQQILLVIARDISERKRIAQQLLQTEKLAAVGRLSASIAHEINNPLQAIHNSLHLLNTRTLSDDKRALYLLKAQEEVDRLIELVQRMLDFYRPARDGVGMRLTDLHHLLDIVLALTAKQLQTSKIHVSRDWHPQLPFVMAIGNQLKQVFLNLILNAIEAMPNGGVLDIHTFVVDDPRTHETASFEIFGSATQRIVGPSVVVELGDTGQGISPDDLPKVFEPFYTTRSTGTGLGLAISYGIIEQHEGELSVSSGIGQGTTFRIYLPIPPA